MNTGLKNDRDEASKKFITITVKEEARKAMIAKRFGENTKGAAMIAKRLGGKSSDVQLHSHLDTHELLLFQGCIPNQHLTVHRCR
jgi:hypothetical protein